MNFRLSRSQASVVATLVIALLLIISASIRYTGFFSLPVFINLFDDNAFLGIAAIGMTFVILSGGIDLSVGSMIGFTSIASALLVERAHYHPLVSALIVLAAAVVFGAVQGFLIAQFEIAPFLVTLAGMFFVRGAAFTLSLESIALTHPLYRSIQTTRLPLGSTAVPPTALFFFVTAIAGLFIATQTRFGRGIYAIGGNATSALLMGLPLKRYLIGTYAFSAFCAALAGLTFSVYTSSGNATAATGLELDVIAAVVIGGTLLTGGQGSILGTVLGVLILGLIQTIINFDGTLNSWWTRIVIGVLLFFFVVLQKLLSHVWLVRSRSTRTSPSGFVAASAAVAVFAFAIAMSPPAFACPPGFESGRRLDNGLVQLTGNNVKSWSLDPGDLPDPAPPYIAADGSIEIYGSSLSYAHYLNRDEFENGGCFERVPLDLRQDNGVDYTHSAYAHPWDVRKFRVEQNGRAPVEILVAGAMSRSGSNTFPIWPDDNQSRRIFMFHRNAQGLWTRDNTPIVGKVEPEWLGHSYGGNFIQVGMTDQNVLQLDRQGDIVFFYDMVSDNTGGVPFKTEMFATHVSNTPALSPIGPQMPVFQINNPPYPSLKRTVGGYLAEGPRPIEMNIQGQTFFIVAFSSGDFSTDYYTLNYAWSRSINGPYKAVLTPNGSDLLDLGQSIKADYGLSWMGRPSFFRSPKGGYEAMFHAVRKDLYPGHDFTKWPVGSLNYYRSLFKVSLAVGLNSQNEPVITLDPHHVVAFSSH